MAHLIAFSNQRWDFVYERPQQMLSRIARNFPVVFIEEPVVSETGRQMQVSSPAPGVSVLRVGLPSKVAGFHDDHVAALCGMIDEYLQSQGIGDCIAWFYTPMALPLLQAVRPRAVVYDCIDELAASDHAPPQMRQRELELMRMAGLVLTGGPTLYAAKRSLNRNVLCLPSAVDERHYDPRRLATTWEAMGVAHTLQGHIPHPRLGFFGVIDERLDHGLIADMADAHPEWHLVMIGPVLRIDPAALPRRPNIHWISQQASEDMPYLVAGWDLCLVPLASNDTTRFMGPTNTLNYLAAGKPVVSTPVPDVLELFDNAVLFASGTVDFMRACATALAETPAARAARMDSAARYVARHSWEAAAAAVVISLRLLLRRQPAEAVRPKARQN